MNPIILTHCGKLGDMLYALPVAEWFYRAHGRQVHWVLPSCFGPFHYVTPLLRQQAHCADVTLVGHKLANLDAGGQPYQFDPNPHLGTTGREYFNLGFRSYPDRFIPEFYAREHGLDWTPGFRLDLGTGDAERGTENAEVIWRTNEEGLNGHVPAAARRLPLVMDLLELARTVRAGREFHTWYCGLAVLAWLAGIPQHVYRQPGHGAKALYFPEDYFRGGHQIQWHDL